MLMFYNKDKEIECKFADRIEMLCKQIDNSDKDTETLFIELEQVLQEYTQYRKNTKSNTAFILKNRMEI